MSEDTEYNKPDIVCEAERNVQAYFSDHAEPRKIMADDIDFSAGNHWTEALQSKRKNRSMLTINDVPAMRRRVEKAFISGHKGIKASPVDNYSDPAVARVFQGVIDAVMRDSMAEDVFLFGMDDQLTAGMGAVEVLTNYVDEDSWNQDICIEYVDNPLRLFRDTTGRRIDGADTYWSGYLESFTKEAFEKNFPGKNPVPFGATDQYIFGGPDSVIVARYYKIHEEADVLAEVIDDEGNTKIIKRSKVGSENFELIRAAGKIEKERDVVRKSVKKYWISGEEVLEEVDIPCNIIPLVFIFGEKYRKTDVSVNFYASLHRFGKDAGRMRDFVKSNMIDELAANPIAPYIGNYKQFEGFEHIWANAWDDPQAYLPYNFVEINGQVVVTPPQKAQPVSPSSGWLSAAESFGQDFNNTLGIQETSLGIDNGEERSGKAILARSDESMASISPFIDSVARSMQVAGRVIAQLLPKYYDTPRIKRIIGPDGEEDLAYLNQAHPETGEFIDFANAKFDVYIDTGPDFVTQRKESAETMLEFMRVIAPEQAAAIAPKVARLLDIKEAKEIAAVLQRTLPENLQAPVEGEEMNFEQAMLMAQQAEAKAKDLEDKLNMAMERIASLNQVVISGEEKNKADMTREMMKQQAESERARLKAQTDIAKQLLMNKNDAEIELLKGGASIKSEQAKGAARIQELLTTFSLELIELMKAMRGNGTENAEPPGEDGEESTRGDENE